MRVGVLAPDQRSQGGIFQYGLELMEAIQAEYEAGHLDRPVLVHSTPTDLPLDRLRAAGWTVAEFPSFRSRRDALLDPLRRLVGEGALRKRWRLLRRRAASRADARRDLDAVVPRPEVEAWLRALAVDLMIYPYPTPLAFQTGIPYVFTVHDLQHRIQPEFPEVSADGEWERREHIYRNATRRATVVLTDSEMGKQDVLRFYGEFGVSPDAIVPLPSIPPYSLAQEVNATLVAAVRERYGLPERYCFYPAQFWPHKNHIGLVEALGELRRRGLEVHFALAGGHTGAVREVAYTEAMAAAERLGVQRQLHLLGYVPDEHMGPLYAGAVALVMPTFFGPTNMPPLEAWAFGCPVLTSEVPGLRDQAGDAAIYADPGSPCEIADGIERLWTDESLRARLVAAGRLRLAESTPELHRRRVVEILDLARRRLQQA